MSTVEKKTWNGKNGYCLECGDMKVLVSPEDGMNLYQVSYKNEEVIAWDEARFERKATYGVPILYPTPNRSADLKIQAAGQVYDARMHGLVKNLSFTVTEEECSESSAALTGVLKWDEGQKDYSMFPFPSELVIKIQVLEQEVIWNYEVRNLGERGLPYGIAIHPFFRKRDQDVCITVPANSVMEMTEEKLPTGKLIPVEGSKMDLRREVPVRSLDLDHVYTDCDADQPQRILYDDFSIELKASEEFTHVVVFTPDSDFFCIENQSCSTDCFNLWAKGFVRESGLELVAAGGKKGGFIRFSFKDRG